MLRKSEKQHTNVKCMRHHCNFTSFTLSIPHNFFINWSAASRLLRRVVFTSSQRYGKENLTLFFRAARVLNNLMLISFICFVSIREKMVERLKVTSPGSGYYYEKGNYCVFIIHSWNSVIRWVKMLLLSPRLWHSTFEIQTTPNIHTNGRLYLINALIAQRKTS